jgi:hypothetical protein
LCNFGFVLSHRKFSNWAGHNRLSARHRVLVEDGRISKRNTGSKSAEIQHGFARDLRWTMS